MKKIKKEEKIGTDRIRNLKAKLAEVMLNNITMAQMCNFLFKKCQENADTKVSKMSSKEILQLEKELDTKSPPKQSKE
jgi:UDP-N-acetyl-D-mannosaminuronic acid transferase (WecB/TagA/CpsF family)